MTQTTEAQTTAPSAPPRRALIAGASIAGPTLAYWLHRYGWETVIVERAPELRTGGQNIDVRGAGRTVSRRMGLEERIRAANTGEVGTRFVDERGGSVAEFPVQRSQSAGATAELEILRGELARLLVGATEDHTEYRYGNRVTALSDEGERVRVSFEHGPDEHFDLVFAADGLRSGTRDLIFKAGEADAPKIQPLGISIAYLTLARAPSDDRWWRWYNAPRGRAITLRPDNVGTTRATLAFLDGGKSGQKGGGKAGSERLSQDEQKALLRRIFQGAGWEARRVLEAVDAAQGGDLYFDTVAQVKAPQWSRGRLVLLGDAAYCASPVSGMGTSLSLVGAYVLAGELAAHVDYRDGLRGYERIMRPYVEKAQNLPPGVPTLAYPATPLGIRVFHGVVKVLATLNRLGRQLGQLGHGAGSRLSRYTAPPADQIDLPDYHHLERQPDV